MTDLILALVTWRIAHMIVYEDMPFSIAARFRNRTGIKYNEHSQRVPTNELAKLFDCVYCVSVWFGWIVALAYYRDWSFIVYGLAYSTVAIIIEKFVSK